MTHEEMIKQLELDKDMAMFNPMTGEEEPMNEECKASAEALTMALEHLKKEESALKILKDVYTNFVSYSQDGIVRGYIEDAINLLKG